MSGALVINIQFTSTPATNYTWTEPEYKGCYGINKNDWLGKIVIFNAQSLLSTRTYLGMIFYNDGSEEETFFPVAKYDKTTDSVTMDFQGKFCLTQISHIEMTQH